jgi:hypothetical protein
VSRLRLLLAACAAAFVLVTPGVAGAQVKPTLHDSCRGVAHGESFKFRDAAGEPLTSPSVILSGFSFNGAVELAGAIVTVTLQGPNGSPARGTATVDGEGRALVAVPISQFGSYSLTSISVFADSPIALVDHAWDAPLVVDNDSESCEKDDLEVGESGEGTNETEPDTDDGIPDWAYYLLAVGGLAAILGGIFMLRGDATDCAELVAECERLKAIARQTAAQAEADAKAATDARDALQAAKKRTAALERAFQATERPPPGTNSYAESEGKRVSVYDVHLLHAAAAKSWGKYKSGENTAADTVREWEHQGNPATLDELRAQDAAERAAQAAAVRDALGEATLAEVAAEQAADAAAMRSDLSRAKAADAALAAAAACAAADACLGTQGDAQEDGIDPPELPKSELFPPSQPTTPEQPTTPPQPQTPPGKDEHKERECKCGPDGTQEFLRMANWLLALLRTCDVSSVKMPDTSMGQTSDPVSKWIAAALLWAKFKLPELGERRWYGLMWCFNNANYLDFWPDPIGPCGSCDECNGTITFRGECLPQHSFGDWMYGFAAGFFGLPDIVIDLGGHYAENKKMFGPGGKLAGGDGPNQEGWGVIRLDPAVSQRCYHAGSAVGDRMWNNPDVELTLADFDALMAAADRQPGCPPCDIVLSRTWHGRKAYDGKFIK